MKRILIACFLLTSLISTAQRREVNNAYLYLREGDYMKAYNCVQTALKHEKTKKYHQTYYHKFNCILYMFAENDTAMLESFVNPADTAYDALMKSICYNFNDTAIQNIDYFTDEGLQKLHDHIFVALNANIPDVQDAMDLEKTYFLMLPAMARLYFVLSMIAYESDDLNEAYTNICKSIKTSEFDELYDTLAYSKAGDFAYDLKKYEEAIEYYQKAVKVNFGKDENEKSKYMAKLANAYLKNKDTAKYISTARGNTFRYKEIAHNETSKLLDFCIKNNYAQIMDESLILLESVSKDYVGVHELKGRLYLSQKEYEKSITEYIKYQENSEEDFDANINLAACYIEFADSNEAISDSLYAEGLTYYKKAQSINRYVSFVNKEIERIEEKLLQGK